MIKTILAPTDGSDHAHKAVDLAADIADKYGARMVILHVLLRHTSATDIKALCADTAAPDTLVKKLEEIETATLSTTAVPFGGPAGAVLVAVPEDALKEVGELIADKARRAAEAKGVKEVTVHVVDGAPADCILAAAEHEGADMIVMGCRGLGRISALLMGSASQKVSHLAPCTCVTVKVR
jgi:nucleotide-binding universal stress UspA family protein